MGNRIRLNRLQRQKYPKQITGHTFFYVNEIKHGFVFLYFLGRFPLFFVVFFFILYIFFPCEFQGIPRDWAGHKEKDDFR